MYKRYFAVILTTSLMLLMETVTCLMPDGMVIRHITIQEGLVEDLVRKTFILYLECLMCKMEVLLRVIYYVLFSILND